VLFESFTVPEGGSSNLGDGAGDGDFDNADDDEDNKCTY
jgi:hypothetical protein